MKSQNQHRSTKLTLKTYNDERMAYWNDYANKQTKFIDFSKNYHKQLRKRYKFLVPKGLDVLEIGCAQGDLLASLEPKVGVGIDFSAEFISQAKAKHPSFTFHCSDAHTLELDGKFDVIILSDIVNDLYDVQGILRQVKRFCKPSTRVILNFYNRVWQLPLKVVRSMGLANPVLEQNWLTPEDVANLLYLEDFQVIRTWGEILMPLQIPLLSGLLNRYFAKISPFRLACLAAFVIARPKLSPKEEPVVSVVVAARNEEGNVEQIVKRVPQMGAGTELIFVEGGSSDNTYGAIEKVICDNPEKSIKLYKQPGKGKGDAVRLGFEKASGDVLMILDADMTVPPEELPRFLEVYSSGKAEFINGVRLVYPMEKRAMRFFNLVGNKFFSLTFTWLLGQPIKDTLCGTKVLSKHDYKLLAANRSYFGDFDPFGDFDLLFGAAKLNLKMVDMPVRYRERTYGDTNISRWKHGLILLRMVVFAAFRIKFV